MSLSTTFAQNPGKLLTIKTPDSNYRVTVQQPLALHAHDWPVNTICIRPDQLTGDSAFLRVTAPHTKNALVQPFYFSQTVITNDEYRKFINYVRDSIAVRMVFDSLPIQEAVYLLKDYPRKKHPLPEDTIKKVLLEKHGLDFENEHVLSEIYQGKYQESIKALYYPQPKRFYKRKEINTCQLYYHWNTSLQVAIYPDTLSILDYITIPQSDPYCNLYFWHPAYDNYPVIGLSILQMQAYAHWVEQQMNKNQNGKTVYRYRVQLPEMWHYELAVKRCLPAYLRDSVETCKTSFTSLQRTDLEALLMLQKVFWNGNFTKNKRLTPELFNVSTFYRNYFSQPILGLFTGTSEVILPYDGTYYSIGGNWKEAIYSSYYFNTRFYRTTVSPGMYYAWTTFRLVINVEEVTN